MSFSFLKALNIFTINTFKYFIIIIEGIGFFISYLGHSFLGKEFKYNLFSRAAVKEYYRKIKLYFYEIYLKLTNKTVQFEIDLFAKQLTNGKYSFYYIFNIYQLKHKDLFRAAYVKLMNESEFLNN
jgi:hypothetical protein